ncbi:MAG TPA: DNA-binding protein [Oribacterium sp.]|jgi:predicted DNA-binding protein with PD1-like motif|nr:DNA-binding protein [Oribacterium sp.]
MDYRIFGNQIVLRIDRGEEVMETLIKLCEKEKIRLGSIVGLGAADYLVMGLYDVEKQQFSEIKLEVPLEITSIIGNITEMDGKPYLHLHINASDANGHTYGGHLKAVRISGTSEIFVTVVDGHVGREKDTLTNTGLNLFKFD